MKRKLVASVFIITVLCSYNFKAVAIKPFHTISKRVKNKSKVYKLRGNASWYGSHWNNRKTASGQIFNSRKLTAAHNQLPLGSKVIVKSLVTGKSVIVTINDRGGLPHGRIIDLSKAASDKLGITKRGVSKVVIIPIEVAESKE